MVDHRHCHLQFCCHGHLRLRCFHCCFCFFSFNCCHVSGLCNGDIFSVIDVSVGDLIRLKVVVDGGDLRMLSHLGSLERGVEGLLGCGHLGGVRDVSAGDLLRLKLLQPSQLNCVELVDEELCGSLHFWGKAWCPRTTDVSGTTRLKKSPQLCILCLILDRTGESA